MGLVSLGGHGGGKTLASNRTRQGGKGEGKEREGGDLYCVAEAGGIAGDWRTAADGTNFGRQNKRWIHKSSPSNSAMLFAIRNRIPNRLQSTRTCQSPLRAAMGSVSSVLILLDCPVVAGCYSTCPFHFSTDRRGAVVEKKLHPM